MKVYQFALFAKNMPPETSQKILLENGLSDIHKSVTYENNKLNPTNKRILIR